ncbi:inosine xanthosine triphosphatase [Chlorella sorokiniana]|uniref:inosine/xanthosine triphosphatase n=1 Tax=Chlorella sorokiniana TaxID=3076 RepID=A0A2P6TN16_CHLSO|nr:inosine xanthosine triphosphatase [Chlorella sorokiniana]|eukprot:PRW45729.1 inosine xanthosine triphosphatase [Chlorella sorokiniana]
MTVARPVVAAAAPGLRHHLSVIVASQNAVKINAVAAALRQALPTVEHRVTGCESQSRVADQPWGDEETLTGAFNRVESIRSHPEAASSLLVAIEGGDADDRVFGRVKSGRGSGTIGQLSGGLITRQAYYEHAALMALLPLMNPQLYPEFDLSLLPGLEGQVLGAAQAAALSGE